MVKSVKQVTGGQKKSGHLTVVVEKRRFPPLFRFKEDKEWGLGMAPPSKQDVVGLSPVSRSTKIWLP